MAEAELARIVGEAASRWQLDAVSVIHRTGRIAPGEEIVAVIALSAHRADAFGAAGFIMDFLKTDAPFWKKEYTAAGTETRWVEAKQTDTEAAARWGKKDSQ
jgi:molybdopterin synthase catalytic subunit